MKFNASESLWAGAIAFAAFLATGDSLAAAAVVVLLLGFKLLSTGDGLVVLGLAFAFQWMQVSIGLFYPALSGRELMTTMDCDYRPMVVLGLGCVLALAAGIRFGVYLVRRTPEPVTARPQMVVTWPWLIALYVTAVVAEPFLTEVAIQHATWRQVLITITVARLALLFLIARRLAVPKLRWQPLMLLIAVEVARGFTGFFAGFREPLVIGAIVLLETFDRRQLTHWLTLGAVVVVMIVASIMWMGVRTTYRAEIIEADSLVQSRQARFQRISDLGSAFFRGDGSDIATAADNVVDRLWAVYYPALAVARVPETLPHTEGALMKRAIVHVLTPRVFFPDKPDLISDSELVRKYAGVWVAGAEQNTSIAFGYAAESYVDYGVPLMFVPSLVFGVLMGVAYAWLVRHLRHVELMIATVNVVFWLALYLFERSWSNTLGTAMSLLVYLALPIAVIDDFLLVRHVLRRPKQAGSEAYI